MNTYPMFRLALFLSAGIFFADTFRWEAGWGPVAALLVLLVVLGLRLRSHSYAYRWVYGVGVSCFMFLVGWVLTGKAWGDVKAEGPTERQVYRGVVKERPVDSMALAAGMPIMIFLIMGAKIPILPKRKFMGKAM